MTTTMPNQIDGPSKTSGAVDRKFKRHNENRSLDHIPGDYGWPIIGNSLDAVFRNLAMNRERYAKYGAVFKNSTMFQRFVAMLSPDAVQYVLLDKEENFSSRLGWHANIGRFFDGGLMLLDFDIHFTHRKLVQTAFRPSALQAYLSQLIPHWKRHIEQWASRSAVHYYPSLKAMMLRGAASVFLGTEISRDVNRLNRAFTDTLLATTAIIRWPIPGFSYWRGLRGRKILEDYFRKNISERRKGTSSDMFSLLCRAQSEEGEMLTDDEIVDHMVFIMVAAHDTTTSAMTMMAYELARNPDWQDECRAEIMAESDSALSFDSLKRLEKLDWTFKEALRLYPPIGVIPRRALREFEFGGYRIPANTTIMVNVAFIQRIPEWWDNPEKFDPLRFSPERAEHRRHPYSWFPFSGGAHQCSGMYMALMQAKAFYSLLLRKYRLRLTDGYKMKFRQFPMPRPLDGLPLELVSLDAN